MLVTICVLIALAVLVVSVRLRNHSQLRRRVLFDRQNLFHSSDAFHVVSALKLKPGQELVEGVGRYVKGVEQHLPRSKATQEAFHECVTLWE